MIGVALLIGTGKSNQEGENELDAVRRSFGGAGSSEDTVPHITLFAARSFDMKSAKPALEALARSCAPITVSVRGLGVLGGSRLSLSLAVARAPRLAALQKAAIEEIGRFGTGLDSDYAVNAWVPHVALAAADSPAAIVTLAEKLSSFELSFDILSGELGFVEATADGPRVLVSHPLDA